jgi:DNA-binding transcriptional ArsR family regulator
MSSTVYAAISHPVRRKIMHALADGPAPVHELGRSFAISQQAVSKHLRVLSDAGLTRSERRGQENIYHLNAAPLNEVRNWLNEFWAMRLEGLKAIAEESDE